MQLSIVEKPRPIEKLTCDSSPRPSLRSGGFWFNTLVCLITMAFDVFLIVKYWDIASQGTISALAFWIGLMFLIGPYVRYYQTYSKLDEFKQVAESWNEEQKSLLNNAADLSRKELDILMGSYLAAVFGLLLCVIRLINHKLL